MKKIIALMLSSLMLFANNQILSPIPPAKIFYINLEPQACDTACLEELLEKEYFISFLTRYEPKYANTGLESAYALLSQDIVPTSRIATAGSDVKIAVLVPQKVIKSYSLIVTNALFSYSIRRSLNSNIKFFLTEDESSTNLNSAMISIKNEGFKFVIAPVTNTSLSVISDPKYSDLLFYIPTININSSPYKNSNLIYGGIDYNEQIQKLLERSNHKIAAFYDGSRLGSMLNSYVLQNSPDAYIREISGNKLNLKGMLDNNSRLKNASIFLNTPLIKTALLSSQFRVFDLNPNAVLSTQINYNNALLSLTQPLDRKNMYIANSISQIDDEITANNEIMGQNITYDWVAYSTTFGFDYLYTNFINQEATPLLSDKVENNQVIYDTKIMRANKFGFYIDENSSTSLESSLPTLP
ncbi:hypothetical protein CIG2463D_0596 [Campylobacter iguaniorum]|uniref:hypothetical protein n=1 Tax=Campylobacter iguaniorum TaxID=1244531 RepID=UPI000739FB02|nr:hypothetical protein [Campylobacter iguaniorum]ALV24191.1 hypothetical protein CIG2463D_0596 [Campylobacter iguaniorum]